VKLVVSIIALVFVLLAVFTAVNWSVLTASTPLSFVVFAVEGPLGVILLGVSLALTLLVVVYAMILRTTWLMESHRLTRQLEEQRKLAEQAESSRITNLQDMIETKSQALRAFVAESSKASIARIEAVEKSLTKTVEEASNSLMAHISYLDDKLKVGSQSRDDNPESGTK